MGGDVILVVEDHQRFAKLIAIEVGSKWPTSIAPDKATALAILDEAAIVAAIVDLGLPDGSGLEIVREIRRSSRSIPVLVLTGTLDRQLVNEVNLHDAGYAVKDAGWQKNVRKFVSELTPNYEQRVRSEVERAGRNHGLSARESQVLELYILGLSRPAIAERLGISTWTVHTHLSGAVHRSGHKRLADLRRAILEAADNG